MTNKEVIARLKQKNWYVKCQNKQDAGLVLQACDDAGITWASREKTTEYYPEHFGTLYESYPFNIGFHNAHCGISVNKKNLYEECELENITDWFFNAIKNNDGNLIPKLTPQNAEQEHWVQIILARLHGIPIEAYSILDNKWIDAGDDCSILMDYKYRIKSKPISTPLPISREIWSHLHKRWRYATMDRDGQTFWHQEKPTKNHLGWGSVDYRSTYPLNFNSEGINWETSLTERPEGV